MTDRVIRIFLSSTFRDFGEERDLLVRKVFPTLRAKLQSRFVDLVDVDLRWGITEEEAERGEVLPICLSEIDRARPYFIGFLGERYGWVPPPDAYPSHVLESQSWLEEHRGGKSVTELEILHGVLNNPHMEGRALFYFRSFEYSSSKGGEYIASAQDDRERQSALKETIRQSGFPVYEDYKSPEHLAELLEKDLWEILDREFPASDVPDAFTRENLQHEAYELPRQRLYIGGDKYLTALDKALSEGKQWILVDGPSGGGKSALLANWLQSVRDNNKNIEVHAHYLGATADATDPVFIVRRLIECIKRKTESTEDLASDPDELLDSLPTWLANASSWCELRDKKFLFVIDALNGLSDRRDLRWFPRMLPKHIHFVISTLPGEVNNALVEKADWSRVSVMPLDATTTELIFTSYLALFNKTLPGELIKQVMVHELSVNPLFLLTLAEELRLFGEHEQLSNRLDHYLTSITVDDLFERVLERIEQDYGADTLREIMTALWAARSGLREEEILGYSGLKPMHWAYIRNALGPTLIDASGRLIFAHDYMRIAVSDRYMAGNNTVGNEGQSEAAINLRQLANKKLSQWFEKYAFQDGQSIVSDERAAEEIPYQWQQAKDWKKLQTTLTKQKMLRAILDHRSEQELLSYWLTLEKNIKTNIDAQYEKAWRKWALDENEQATGDLAKELAGFLTYAGRHQKFTEQLLHIVLANSKKLRGAEDISIAWAQTNIGLLFKSRGDYVSAEPFLQGALNLFQIVCDPDHPDVSAGLNNIATIMQAQGDYKAANKLYKKSLEIKKNFYGVEHVETASGYLNLATNSQYMGSVDAAETLYRKGLNIFETCLGTNHNLTAMVSNNLAGLLIEKGEIEQAEVLIKKALSFKKNFLGSEHPSTLESTNTLANLLNENGDFLNAELLYRENLELRERVLGPKHPDTISSVSSLGALFIEKGDYENAEIYCRRALKLEQDTLGPEHPETIKTLSNLAVLLRDKGDLDGAERCFWLSYKLRNKVLGTNHPLTLRSIENLAFLLQNMGKIESAEPLLKLIITALSNLDHVEATHLTRSLYLLAENQRLQKKFTEATEYYAKVREIEEQELGPEHPEMASTYYGLGMAIYGVGNYAEAENYFQKTLNIELQELGEEDSEIAITLLWLGESQFNQAKFDDAEQNLQRALSLQITQNSERDVSLKPVLELLRDVSHALGKEVEARDYAEKINMFDG